MPLSKKDPDTTIGTQKTPESGTVRPTNQQVVTNEVNQPKDQPIDDAAGRATLDAQRAASEFRESDKDDLIRAFREVVDVIDRHRDALNKHRASIERVPLGKYDKT